MDVERIKQKFTQWISMISSEYEIEPKHVEIGVQENTSSGLKRVKGAAYIPYLNHVETFTMKYPDFFLDPPPRREKTKV